MNITIRRTEPNDAEAIAKIFSGPKVIWGTLQIPYPSAEMWRKRFAEPTEGVYSLVACVDGQVVGNLGLHTFPNHPRRATPISARRLFRGGGETDCLINRACSPNSAGRLNSATSSY